MSGVVRGITITATMPRRRADKRHALRVVAGRGADHAALRGRVVQRGDLVVGAAQLEREDRLQVLALEQDVVAQPARQPAGRLERGLDRDVVDARLEDAFDVTFLHDGVWGHARTLPFSTAGRPRFTGSGTINVNIETSPTLSGSGLCLLRIELINDRARRLCGRTRGHALGRPRLGPAAVAAAGIARPGLGAGLRHARAGHGHRLRRLRRCGRACCSGSAGAWPPSPPCRGTSSAPRSADCCGWLPPSPRSCCWRRGCLPCGRRAGSWRSRPASPRWRWACCARWPGSAPA